MADAQTPTPYSRKTKRWLVAILVVLALLIIVGALAGLVTWSLTRQPAHSASNGTTLVNYRSAWASAMEKASVDATFPTEPVMVDQLRSDGQHTFQATFTEDEISALVNVYRYPVEDAMATLERVSVQFPAAGRAALNGSAIVNGSGYSAALSSRVDYRSGQILAEEPIEVTVEGFRLRGDRRTQAIQAIVGYLNAMLDAAPGLTVLSAEVVKGGVRVTGVAPDRLINPPPAPLEQKAASRS